MHTQTKILFSVNMVKWFDKINGNTYHSVRITDTKTGKTYVDKYPYSYGYGETYKQTTLQILIDNQLIDAKYTEQSLYGMYQRENNYPIIWNVTNGKKKEMVYNGSL